MVIGPRSCDQGHDEKDVLIADTIQLDQLLLSKFSTCFMLLTLLSDLWKYDCLSLLALNFYHYQVGLALSEFEF